MAAKQAQVEPVVMTCEEPLYVRANGYDYDHEVLVARDTANKREVGP